MTGKENYFRSLFIMHKAMLYGLCFFIAAVFFIIRYEAVTPMLITKDVSKLIAVLIFIGVALIWVSIFYFKQRTRTLAASSKPVSEKLDGYRSTNIVRWAIMELATICFILAYFLSGIKEIILLQILMIGLFFIAGTNKRRAMQHLELSEAELPNT